MGVTKMSPDEGEKFYMEYWQFEGALEKGENRDTASQTLRGRDEDAADGSLINITGLAVFRPPFALHTKFGRDSILYDDMSVAQALEGQKAAAALATLEKRDFTCPTGTSDCSAIGYPNSCCTLSETCFLIQDTGLGPVGCCETGQTCGGVITSCNAPNTACADNLGGKRTSTTIHSPASPGAYKPYKS